MFFNEATFDITGTLGKDPEQIRFGNDKVMVKMPIAVNERYKTQSGEYADHTSWFDIVMFGKSGEMAMKYLRKGSRVRFKGSIQKKQRENNWYYDFRAYDFRSDEIAKSPSGGGSGRSQERNEGGYFPNTPPPNS